MAPLLQIIRSPFRPPPNRQRDEAGPSPFLRRITSALSALLILPILSSAASLTATSSTPTSTTNTTTTTTNLPPAKIKISGYGLLGDWELKKLITMIEEGKEKRTVFDANFLEDAALILLSRLHRDGHLLASVSADVTLTNGVHRTFSWDEHISEPLPRPLLAREAHFQVHPSILFYFDEIRFSGLESLTEEQAAEFFIETGTLIPTKSSRIYTPERLRAGLDSITETLARKGFESATAKESSFHQNNTNGAVTITIQIAEGKKSLAHSLSEYIFYNQSTAPGKSNLLTLSVPFSKFWEQDYIQQERKRFYALGYPDTTVVLKQIRRTETNSFIRVDLEADIHTGAKFKIGEIIYRGLNKTKTSVLDRRVKLKSGELLDRTQTEAGRYRLAQLGIFDSVEVEYQNVDEHTRNVIYHVKEGKQLDFSLLFGYGSYELLRGGIDVEQHNVFGRAHQAHLRLVQSFKASSGDYLYTMPELFGENIDGFFDASALRRQEISFTREEYGGGAGVRKFYKPIQSDVSVRYNYQVVNAADTDLPIAEHIRSAGVGSVITDIKHDQLDNPLYPHQGYKLFSTVELASTAFGGDVDFQRVQLAGAYHHPFTRGRWLHLGLMHGFVFTINGSGQDLPFNKRFFPGGENSVRGYQEGEAAPRDASGKVIGAETFLQGNIEFEQALTPSWSVVTFFDAIGFSEHIEQYPMTQALYSVGAGIRWKTLIGPARLEYGYNLNRRPFDPAGTIHFSIGFPF